MKASNILKGFDFGSRTARALSLLENEAVSAQVDALMSGDQAKACTNKAGTFRFVECCAFIAQKTTDRISAVHAVAIAALASAKQEKFSFADLHHVAGAQMREGTEAQAIKGVSKARLNKLIGACPDLGTVSSRVSNCMGKNGFLSVLGVCSKEGAQSVRVLNAGAPFVVAYVQALNSLSDGQFSSVLEKLAQTDKGE